MTDFAALRLHYTRLFVLGLLCAGIYILSQSLGGGFSQIDANLPGRAYLMAQYARLRLRLGDRVFPQGLVGKDGWLEFTGEGNLDDFQNSAKIPTEELEATRGKIQALYDELHRRNITLLIVIAPNKATLYPDKLPDEIKKIGGRSRLDAFTRYMQRHGPPVVVDLRPALREARQKWEIYYKTDTHWNSFGAFAAQAEIIKALSRTHPGLQASDLDEFDLQAAPPVLHDIPRLMGVMDIREAGTSLVPHTDNVTWINQYVDNSLTVRVSYTPRADSPRLLMYIDSFGIPLAPFMAPHFSTATFMRRASQYPDTLTFREVEAFKPDIVILEFAERYQNQMDYFLDNFGLESWH